MIIVTVFHGLHVAVGAMALSVVVVMVTLVETRSCHCLPVELTGWYWHFVDLVWVSLWLAGY